MQECLYREIVCLRRKCSKQVLPGALTPSMVPISSINITWGPVRMQILRFAHLPHIYWIRSTECVCVCVCVCMRERETRILMSVWQPNVLSSLSLKLLFPMGTNVTEKGVTCSQQPLLLMPCSADTQQSWSVLMTQRSVTEETEYVRREWSHH